MGENGTWPAILAHPWLDNRSEKIRELNETHWFLDDRETKAMDGL